MNRAVVYDDAGSSALGVASLRLTLPRFTDLAAQTATAADIKAGILDKAAMLVMPGGADLPYCERLNGAGNAAIRQFVAAGGLYLGICAGAYYACTRIDFRGQGGTISGARELAFFPGTAVGSLPDLTGGVLYAEEDTASKALVPLVFADGANGGQYYYHGGPAFIADEDADAADYTVAARFADGLPALVCGRFGLGRYILSAVHFELDAEAYRRFAAETETEAAPATALTDTYGQPIWQLVCTALNRP